MKTCSTNHRNVQRMSAVIAENLREPGTFILTEKATCTDCGALVYRYVAVALSGTWTPRKPENIGERSYACVALRQKSA